MAAVVSSISSRFAALGVMRGSSNDPRAMPLNQFIGETMTALGTDGEQLPVN
jgi:hypothetical protein